MEMIVSNTDGLEQSKLINMQLGTVGVHDPLGPDAYGYYIYDIRDTILILHLHMTGLSLMMEWEQQ